MFVCVCFMFMFVCVCVCTSGNSSKQIYFYLFFETFRLNLFVIVVPLTRLCLHFPEIYVKTKHCSRLKLCECEMQTKIRL